ncbi:unnamed protein product [Adineta steineri]|uniref:Uncharacterized protein n=1 Tax=Adineta steineri TaxID=433720 RepID=A0A815R7Z3_9BILA|nr:unnamed protein product [Adineta steineri]CAF4115698.1 unnamed protein product [Adineta steineri]
MMASNYHFEEYVNNSTAEDDRQRLYTLQEELNHFENEHRQAERDLMDIDQRLDEARILQKQLEHDIYQFNGQMQQKNEAVIQANNHLDKLRKQERELITEYNKFELILAAEKKTLSEAKNKVDEMNNQIDQLKQDKIQLDQRRNELAEAQRTCEEDKREVEKQLMTIENQLHHLEQDLKCLRAEVKQLEQVISELKKEIKRTNDKMGRLDREIAGLKDSIQALEKEKMEIEVEIRGIEDKKLSIKKIIDLKQSEVKELNVLRDRRKAEKAAADEEKQDAEAVVTTLQKEITQLKNSIEELRKTVEQLRNEVLEWEEKARMAKNDVQKTEEAVKIVQEEVIRLQNEVSKIGDDLQKKTDELNKANELKFSLDKDLESKQKELKQAKQHVIDMTAQLQTAAVQLEQAVQQLGRDKETLVQAKKKEDEIHKVFDHQQAKVNQADKMVIQRTDEESRAQREYDEVLRAEQDAHNNLRCDEAEAQSREDDVRRAEEEVASIERSTSDTGLSEARTRLDRYETELRDCKSRVNASQRQFDRRKQTCEQKYKTYQQAIRNKTEAQNTLKTESTIFETRRTEWQQQIPVRETADKEVIEQTKVKDRATKTYDDLKRRLDEAKIVQTNREGHLRDATAKVQKQTEQITLLTIQQKGIQDQHQENQTKLLYATKAKQTADTQHQNAIETEKTTVRTLNEKQSLLKSKSEDLQQAESKLEAKNAELLSKERTLLEAKNKLTAIEDVLKMLEMPIAELQEQMDKQELLLKDERQKLVTCAEKRGRVDKKVETSIAERKKMEEEHNRFKKELRVKNQTMQDKDDQVTKANNRVKKAHEARDTNENSRQQHLSDLKAVCGEIIQNDYRLQENADAFRTRTETMTRHKANLQTKQRQVQDTQKHLSDLHKEREQLKNEIDEKQKAANKCHDEHRHLLHDVNQQTANKNHIDKKCQALHNQRMDKVFAASVAAQTAARRQVAISEMKNRNNISNHKRAASRQQYDHRLNPNQQYQKR